MVVVVVVVVEEEEAGTMGEEEAASQRGSCSRRHLQLHAPVVEALTAPAQLVTCSFSISSTSSRAAAAEVEVGR